MFDSIFMQRNTLATVKIFLQYQDTHKSTSFRKYVYSVKKLFYKITSFRKYVYIMKKIFYKSTSLRKCVYNTERLFYKSTPLRKYVGNIQRLSFTGTPLRKYVCNIQRLFFGKKRLYEKMMIISRYKFVLLISTCLTLLQSSKLQYFQKMFTNLLYYSLFHKVFVLKQIEFFN